MDRHRLGIKNIWAITALSVFFLCPMLGLEESASAATLLEVIDLAREGVAAKQDTGAIVDACITECTTSNIDLVTAGGALGETMLESFVQSDRAAAYSSAGQIAIAALNSLSRTAIQQTEVYRVFGEFIAGIRVAGNRNQLDPNLLQVSIENAIAASVDEAQREALLRILASAFTAPLAATYTPPTPAPRERNAPTPPGGGGDSITPPPTYSGELPT